MIISVLSGFISGIAFGSLFHFPIWLFLTLLSLASIFFAYRYFLDIKKRLHITILALFFLTFVLGVARISYSDLYKESTLNEYLGQKIIAEGIVSSEPDVRENNTKLTVKLEKIIDGNKATIVSEKVLVTVPIYPEYEYGDKVRVDIKLEKPENFATNNDSSQERIFDYVGFLRAKEIWYVAKYGKVELISADGGNFIKRNLYKIKNAFEYAISNALPEPESSLLNGILLGAKQSLGKDLLSEFQKTGTSHVVVLSGYNIAIVADFIVSFFSFLPKMFSLYFGIAGIALFTILSGASSSAVRAAIMVSVALIAKNSNRDYKAGRILGFTTVLMLAPNPMLLVFDPSFQLSVLATIGLVYVSSIVSEKLKFVPEKFLDFVPLREIISATLSTQITVLPFLLYSNGLLSLVSLPVNILVLGTIPATMFLGFFTGLFGLVSLYLSFIPAFFSYILLWYQLKIIHLGSILPFSTVSLPNFSPFILALIYFLLLVYFFERKQKT
jgi:competence protein ComEC